MKRALVLFSGGLDSTTALHIARSRDFEPLTLIFQYGQRHSVEVERAVALAKEQDVDWRLQVLDLGVKGGSALTSHEIEVPRNRPDREISAGVIPVTYVPARNTIFLAHALAWAEVEEIDDIFVGINAIDYSGYPDCRPEYLKAFEALGNLASRRSTQEGHRLRCHAPLLYKTKAEIITWGTELGVDYSRTWSCYAPREVEEKIAVGTEKRYYACGECDSCLLRMKGFREAGVEDPTEYWAPR